MKAFTDFFAGEFQRALDATEIPGMEGVSWDRRAAWLFWNAIGRPEGAITRYFYHPESDSYFTDFHDGPLITGEAVELDEADWRARQSTAADPEIDDLLG